jgi:hypothetical protein
MSDDDGPKRTTGTGDLVREQLHKPPQEFSQPMRPDALSQAERTFRVTLPRQDGHETTFEIRGRATLKDLQAWLSSSQRPSGEFTCTAIDRGVRSEVDMDIVISQVALGSADGRRIKVEQVVTEQERFAEAREYTNAHSLDVSSIQQMLAAAGYLPSEHTPGAFDSVTYSAVRRFQREHKDSSGASLVVDGKVGEKTLTALRESVPETAVAAGEQGERSYIRASGERLPDRDVRYGDARADGERVSRTVADSGEQVKDGVLTAFGDKPKKEEPTDSS